jgi:alpha-glucosidase
VPLPWSGDRPPYGFSPLDAVAAPWLPQPDWADRTVQAEDGDPDSFLELYRAALAVRRRHPALGDGFLTWDAAAPEQVLGFHRDPGFTCWVNFSDMAVPLPDTADVLVASGPLQDRMLGPDQAVWLQERR